MPKLSLNRYVKGYSDNVFVTNLKHQYSQQKYRKATDTKQVFTNYSYSHIIFLNSARDSLGFPNWSLYEAW